jgi:hypothetical protein
MCVYRDAYPALPINTVISTKSPEEWGSPPSLYIWGPTLPRWGVALYILPVSMLRVRPGIRGKLGVAVATQGGAHVLVAIP